jgi:2-dehydro-3-deoxygalactonokinase
VSRGGETDTFVGVNWGSTNFRAFLIGADGSAIDEYAAPAGVMALDRHGMAATMDDLAARWPNSGPAYASGMIGSNVGWTEVPYAEAPAGCADLAVAAMATKIGAVSIHIVPGIACRRSFDGEPDILRGEEIELIGLAALRAVDGWVALPGTHTKWARLENGRVVDFFTSMSGEIFDRLTTKGLLSSIVDGEAADGPVFLRGVSAGRAHHLTSADY